MTRKDYILLAAALKAAKQDITSKETNASELNNGVNYAIEHVAEALGRDNPRFSRERFFTAAGFSA